MYTEYSMNFEKYNCKGFDRIRDDNKIIDLFVYLLIVFLRLSFSV